MKLSLDQKPDVDALDKIQARFQDYASVQKVEGIEEGMERLATKGEVTKILKDL